MGSSLENVVTSVNIIPPNLSTCLQSSEGVEAIKKEDFSGPWVFQDEVTSPPSSRILVITSVFSVLSRTKIKSSKTGSLVVFFNSFSMRGFFDGIETSIGAPLDPLLESSVDHGLFFK